MATNLLLAVPLAVLWLGITNRISLESFVVGYLLGLGIVVTMRLGERVRVEWRRLPDQLLGAVIYVVILYRDILLSGLDLARRLLSRDMRLRLGILAIPTQDPQDSRLVAALSAVNIGLTPGTVVIDFDGNSVIYVHYLDVVAMAEIADAEQAQRLKMLERVLGRSS